MASLAAHLVDDVLGGLPVRQWVLTTPHRLRYALAYGHRLWPARARVFIRGCCPSSGAARGAAVSPTVAVTAIQRFGSAANDNVHFHSLVARGVFTGDDARFLPLPALSDHDVWRVLATVRSPRRARPRGATAATSRETGASRASAVTRLARSRRSLRASPPPPSRHGLRSAPRSA